MKDLKTLYLSLIMLFSISILIFVIYDNKTLSNYDVYYIDSFEDNVIDIYVLDENEKVVSIPMSFAKLDYLEVFKVYNEKMNAIKVGYHSPLIEYSNCLNISTINNTLFIQLESVSDDVNIDKLLMCFINTFSYFDIDKIELRTGKSIFNIDINDIT